MCALSSAAHQLAQRSPKQGRGGDNDTTARDPTQCQRRENSGTPKRRLSRAQSGHVPATSRTSHMATLPSWSRVRRPPFLGAPRSSTTPLGPARCRRGRRRPARHGGARRRGVVRVGRAERVEVEGRVLWPRRTVLLAAGGWTTDPVGVGSGRLSSTGRRGSRSPRL